MKNSGASLAEAERPEPSTRCVLCDADAFEVTCSAAEVQAQLAYLERFHRRRLRRAARRKADLVDRADFTQNDVTDILTCTSCGLVSRRTQPLPQAAAATYAGDHYGTERLEALYQAQVDLFRPRAAHLAAMMGPRREPPVVVEIGSFVGGFLTAARERGWDATGIDPGREVGQFCRTKGLHVLEAPATEVAIAPHSVDAVVVWNTFDQLPNPHAILAAARNWLRPSGLFALRVPSGLCFRACMPRLQSSPIITRRVLQVAMAWNNLLAFPYLHGYAIDTLDRLLARCTLRRIAFHPSVLPRLADANTKQWAAMEERLVKAAWRAIARRNGGSAPWFDIYYRVEESQ